MSTYTQFLYHIVFATKNRQPVLLPPGRPEFFLYLAGILRRRDSEILAINGVEDHVHLLVSLHPSVCLADLIKDLKLASGQWIRRKEIFPAFRYWQDGYSAFTCSVRERAAVIRYIKKQEEHHKQVSFRDELKAFLVRAGIEFDARYLP
ncbi:MAG: IS200/IS605 family transposase [Planctomycetota bacterium]